MRQVNASADIDELYKMCPSRLKSLFKRVFHLKFEEVPPYEELIEAFESEYKKIRSVRQELSRNAL